MGEHDDDLDQNKGQQGAGNIGDQDQDQQDQQQLPELGSLIRSAAALARWYPNDPQAQAVRLTFENLDEFGQEQELLEAGVNDALGWLDANGQTALATNLRQHQERILQGVAQEEEEREKAAREDRLTALREQRAKERREKEEKDRQAAADAELLAQLDAEEAAATGSSAPSPTDAAEAAYKEFVEAKKSGDPDAILAAADQAIEARRIASETQFVPDRASLAEAAKALLKKI